MTPIHELFCLGLKFEGYETPAAVISAMLLKKPIRVRPASIGASVQEMATKDAKDVQGWRFLGPRRGECQIWNWDDNAPDTEVVFYADFEKLASWARKRRTCPAKSD